MKSILFLSFFSILFISACSLGDVDDHDFRVEVLYEHTVLMKNYANSSVLEQVGLNMSYFPKDSSFLSIKEKKELLRDAYNLENDDLATLENEMNRMMDDWVKLQDIS